MQSDAQWQGMRLFGTPAHIDGEGRETVFAAERRFQLLAYLACRRRWTARDELAEMFWPDRTRGAARSNLRKVLLLAQQTPGLPPLDSQGSLLRWMPASDLSQFESAVAEGRHADALTAYRPPLLAGMDAGLPRAAADWLDFERQRVTSLWRSAAAAQLAMLHDDPEATVSIAQALLAFDPYEEAALLALCEGLGALGRPSQALHVLQRHANRLAEQFGLEPSGPLRRIAARFQAGGAGNSSLSFTPRANVVVDQPSEPSPQPQSRTTSARSASTSFIGRRTEIAQLRRLLDQDTCHLLTLTGPPGIGKTALARHAMAFLAGGFARGAAWVPLEDLTDAVQVPARVASILAIELAGDRPAWPQIEASLAGASLLLVLDNAEHLALAPALTGLIETCPKLRLVVTSRARVGAAGEWLLPLDGLPLPDDDETDADVLRRCDAVQLFERRALQRTHDFDLGSAAVDVVRLMHVVEGLPLAIELAAAWTRVMPVGEIVAELALSLDLLEPGPGAAPERGLRAGFAQSWRLLTPAERDALAQLALLPGAFGREMAQQVAGASLPVLAALVDKSLVRPEPGGRFSMHALLRQCAAAHANDAAKMAERHARYVGQTYGRYGEMGQMPLAEIEADLPHARAAWQWALACRDAPVVLSMATALDVSCQQRGWWAEGFSAFTAAVTAFDDGASRHQRPLQVALLALAKLEFLAGDLGKAEHCTRRSLKIARQLGDGLSIRNSSNVLGSILCQRGQFAQALMFYERTLRLDQKDADRSRLARILSNVAVAEEGLGRYERSLDASRSSLAVHREIGRMDGAAKNLNNMGNVLRVLQRWHEALSLLHESLALCEKHGLSNSRCSALSISGQVYAEQGRHDLAVAWLDRALRESRSHGEPAIEASTLLTQARIEAVDGACHSARSRAKDALTIARRLQSRGLQLQCVLALGEICVHEGQRVPGAALVQWYLSQSGMYRSNIDVARRRVDALDLSSVTFEAATVLLPTSATLEDALALATTGS